DSFVEQSEIMNVYILLKYMKKLIIHVSNTRAECGVKHIVAS
ncbi:MAG: hypothetical protein ACI9FJ_003381, partial [Alteromonadaceae bacterium]